MELHSQIQTKPELYSPFWISVTLVFCLFAFGNLSGLGKVENYDYAYLSMAFSVVFGFILIVPFLLYFFIKFQGQNAPFLHLLNLIGYAQVFFIPAAILAMFPVWIWQMFVFGVAFGLSSLCYYKNLPKLAKIENQQIQMIICGFMVFMNFMMMITMKMKFYYS